MSNGAATAAGPSGPAPKPNANKITYPRQDQRDTNWCWAAVTTSVDHAMDSASTLKQCALVNFGVNQDRADNSLAPLAGDCCERKTRDHNVPLSVHVSLKGIGRAGEAHAAQLPFEEIQFQIDHGRPVVVRIEWRLDGTGHFVAITGYSILPNGDRMLLVQDPNPKVGKHSIKFETFQQNYPGNGFWSETHLINERKPPKETPFLKALGK